MIKNTLFIILLFLLSNSHAEEADLGRLFFNENERQEISRLYKQSLVKPEQAQEIEAIEQPIIPSNITLNGLIIRSNGKNTVWIDEMQNPHEEGLYGLQIDIENLSIDQVDVPILIHSGEIQVYLKPGQKMDTTNGFVRETYADTVMPANDS